MIEHRRLRGVIAALGAGVLVGACALDFDRFDPSDAGPSAPEGLVPHDSAPPDTAVGANVSTRPDGSGETDGGSKADAVSALDALEDTGQDAHADASVDGSCPAPASCLTQARDCNATCTTNDQECVFSCAGSVSCRDRCTTTEQSCMAECTTTCVSCSQSAGCTMTGTCEDAG